MGWGFTLLFPPSNLSPFFTSNTAWQQYIGGELGNIGCWHGLKLKFFNLSRETHLQGC
jgi:hypothetical protein